MLFMGLQAGAQQPLIQFKISLLIRASPTGTRRAMAAHETRCAQALKPSAE
jgi:hypothetical protein